MGKTMAAAFFFVSFFQLFFGSLEKPIDIFCAF